MGAMAASETTAAALDVGQALRRDPFAMLPFCGYNMADYWAHWFAMGDRLNEHAPAVFYVNWFRTSKDGRWLWPGFGDNSRVLKWMCQRVEGKLQAKETPIGNMPLEGDLDLSGLEIPAKDFAELMEVNVRAFKSDIADAEAYLAKFGDKVPARLAAQLEALKSRLG
jgi:phosphoenolpyruvate carboxykinase (GTP)